MITATFQAFTHALHEYLQSASAVIYVVCTGQRRCVRFDPCNVALEGLKPVADHVGVDLLKCGFAFKAKVIESFFELLQPIGERFGRLDLQAIIRAHRFGVNSHDT